MLTYTQSNTINMALRILEVVKSTCSLCTNYKRTEIIFNMDNVMYENENRRVEIKYERFDTISPRTIIDKIIDDLHGE